MVYMPENKPGESVSEKWKGAWNIPAFRFRFVSGIAGVTLVLLSFPVFFQTIQLREGTPLQDPFLSRFPAVDVSVFIFILIWAATIWMLIRAFRNPHLMLVFAWSYFILCLSRMLTIFMVPLEPPAGIIELLDPLTNLFYGKHFVTKDLFYSGHTSTLALFTLLLEKRTEKWLMGLATVCLGVLLMIQHVHYTIDVLAAFPFTWIMYSLGKKMAI